MIRFYLSLFLVTFLATLILQGCESSQKIQGGTAEHNTGGFTMTYTPPGGGEIKIRDDRERVATTQPSITATGDKVNIGQKSSAEGTLGGFSVATEEFKRTPTPWVLIGCLLILAVGFYLTKQFIWCGLCIAAIVVGLVQPMILVWAVILGVAVLLYVNRKQLAQVLKGNQKALQSLPPESIATLMAEWSHAQDEKTRAVVRDIKKGFTEPIPDPIIVPPDGVVVPAEPVVNTIDPNTQ